LKKTYIPHKNEFLVILVEMDAQLFSGIFPDAAQYLFTHVRYALGSLSKSLTLLVLAYGVYEELNRALYLVPVHEDNPDMRIKICCRFGKFYLLALIIR